MGAKILVVDDDAALRQTVERYLKGRSYGVISTDNGSEALLLARESRPDLVLSDAEMPGLDGHTLCRVLKKEPDLQATPLILMSGKLIQDKDILSGLSGGADDYILKPFSLPVLEAKIQVVLRRYQGVRQTRSKLIKHGLSLDPAGRTVTMGKKPVPLTRKEFDLLTALLGAPGRVLSISYLLETVWGYDPADYNDPGTVEVHVSHLRKKLGPKLARCIVNVTGHGYKFED